MHRRAWGTIARSINITIRIGIGPAGERTDAVDRIDGGEYRQHAADERTVIIVYGCERIYANVNEALRIADRDLHAIFRKSVGNIAGLRNGQTVGNFHGQVVYDDLRVAVGVAKNIF